MAERLNNAIRSDGVDNMLTNFNSGVLEIRTGAQPASANDVASGTLLVSITLPNPAWNPATSGVASKSGTWQGTAVATGTAGWCRMRNSADTRRVDGAVTATSGGGEIELDNTSIVSGGTVTISTASFTLPAS